MPYTLGCCFFGPPNLDGHPAHGGVRRLYTSPAQFQGLGEWSPSMVHPAIWVGIAALMGLGVLLYRRRDTSLSGLLIRADGTEEAYKPTRKKFSLEELQRAVDGYIEQVPVKLPGRRKMWANEEGLMERLPVNEKATRMALENGYPSTIPLVGDVLITEPG